MKQFVFNAVFFACFCRLVYAADLYVAPTGNATPPYDTWASAATNIQAAVDAAIAGDTVWVTNGVYATGSRVTPGYASLNRLVITNNIIVRSVNGPEHTFIVGARAVTSPDANGNGVDAVRGVYMSAGLLAGFTITNGHTRRSPNTGDASGGDNGQPRSHAGGDKFGRTAVSVGHLINPIPDKAGDNAHDQNVCAHNNQTAILKKKGL